MTSVRKSLVYSLSGKYLGRVISLASTIIIARLLTPAEVGTFAVASALVMIISEFRMLGANTYLIREASINEAKIRSSYGLTIIISWSLGVAILITAPYIANFFDLAELKYVFWILSISFFAAPYISIPNALLSREYGFDKITIIGVTGGTCQLASVVIFILLGLSFYSLALSQVVTVLVRTILSLHYTRKYKIYRPAFTGLRPIASLGIYTTLGNLFRNAQLSLPDMVLGKMSTPQNVGIFSRGLGFINFVSESILSGITPVAMPFLAKSKNSNSDFSTSYCLATSLITFLIWPILIVCSIASYPAIVFLFGDQWKESSTIASILAIWGILRSGHILAFKALIVHNFEKAMVKKEFIVISIFVFSLIYGFQYGLTGVAYAFVFAGTIDFLMSVVLLKRLIGITYKQQFHSVVKSFIASVVCLLAVLTISFYRDFTSENSFITLLYIAIILPPVWLAMAFALNHPIKKELLGLYNEIKKVKFMNESTNKI